MLIEIELGKRADVDAEPAVLRNRSAEFVIEPVNPLNDQHLPFPERQHLSAQNPPAGDEVEDRHIDRSALKQRIHVPSERLHVQRVETLKIRLSIRTGLQLGAVPEIVVRPDVMRRHPVGGELNHQTLGERGFAGRGRTGDHHEFDASPFRDLLRQIRDRALLQRLGHQHHP